MDKDPGSKQAHVVALRSGDFHAVAKAFKSALLELGSDKVDVFDSEPPSDVNPTGTRYRLFNLGEWTVIWSYSSHLSIAERLSKNLGCVAANAEMIRGPWALSVLDKGAVIDVHTPSNELWWDYGEPRFGKLLADTGQGQGNCKRLAALLQRPEAELRSRFIHLSQSEYHAHSLLGLELFPPPKGSLRVPGDWYGFLDLLDAIGVPQINAIAWNEVKPQLQVVASDVKYKAEGVQSVELDEFDWLDWMQYETSVELGELPTTGVAGATALLRVASAFDWNSMRKLTTRLEKLPALELAAAIHCARLADTPESIEWTKNFLKHDSLLVKIEAAAASMGKVELASPVTESLALNSCTATIRHDPRDVRARDFANRFRASLGKDTPEALKQPLPRGVTSTIPWMGRALDYLRSRGVLLEGARADHLFPSFNPPKGLEEKPACMVLEEGIRRGQARFSLRWSGERLVIVT